jgi:predicted AAA+ superfamily ATPase
MNFNYIDRLITKDLTETLNEFPAVAILGPRQCGKSTLARYISSKIDNSLYLDLENPSDLYKLNDAYSFFARHQNKIICLDEIQRKPEIFNLLRSIIDKNNRNGQFLILGSASRDLIKQTSESLAGRVIFHELTPFLISEIADKESQRDQKFHTLWLRGGFPRSYLARSDKSSFRWLDSFIKAFLERDIPQLGFQIPADNIRRLWKMLAHQHGQIINLSHIGNSLGLSHTTVRKYIDLLAQTFMIRVLSPYQTNLKKRLVKSPKIYIRDTGILHALLDIDNFESLWSHPVVGSSWESVVIENIIPHFSGWESFFYRTSAGAEIDVVLVKGRKKIAIECKNSQTPNLSKGFWIALEDLNIDEAYVIAPVDETIILKKNVKVMSLFNFLIIKKCTQKSQKHQSLKE